MVLSGLCYSIVPLLLVTFSGEDFPFFFNATYRIGGTIGGIIVVCWVYRALSLGMQDLKTIGSHLRRKDIFIVITPYFSYTAFAWSASLVDVAITTIMLEIWPVLFIIFTARLLEKENRFRPTSATQLTLVLLGFLGFGFVVLSQVNGLELSGGSVFWGTILAILAAFMASATAYNYRWAFNLKNELSSVEIEGEGDNVLLFFCLMLAFTIGSFTSAIANLFLGIAFETSGEFPSWNWLEILGIVVIGGILLDAGGTIFNRTAHLKTSNLGINAIGYGTPVFALGWLYLFSQANVAQPDYLFIGAATIISANLVLNFEAEIRWGFKALILALGSFGTIVYLRDGLFSFIAIGQWSWNGGGYFESITLAATVFILLLAFRVARLVSRTSEEDSRTFIMHRKLEMLVRRGKISPQVFSYVIDLDRANNNSAAEKLAYEGARSLIENVYRPDLNEADSQLLSDAEAQLDALARSRQVDIHLGEQFALWIFGGITIGLALFSLPSNAEIGWTRLLVDLFAMLISAVVLFLLFHIQDLQRERDQQKFEDPEPSHDERPKMKVKFLDLQQRSTDKWLSLIAGGALVATYATLLFLKWLG